MRLRELGLGPGSTAPSLPTRRAAGGCAIAGAVRGGTAGNGTRLRGRLIPWPWTLNVAGQSERYATRAAACAGLRRALVRAPVSRIDAGLGQINLGYQAHHYDNPCDLLDPYRNLALAAEILQEQHESGEDWLVAIGRYHRPAGGEPAARYRRSVHQHLMRVLGPAASPSLARSHQP